MNNTQLNSPRNPLTLRDLGGALDKVGMGAYLVGRACFMPASFPIHTRSIPDQIQIISR